MRNLKVSVRVGISVGVSALAMLLGGCVDSFVNPNPNLLSVTFANTRGSIAVGDTQQMTATVINNTYPASVPTVVWSIDGIPGGNSTYGTIDSTGFYTTPAAVPANPSVTVSVTVTTAFVTKTASVNLLITAPTVSSVSVSCAGATAVAAQALQCASTVQGDGSFSRAVIWSVNGIAGGNAAVGLITSQGVYVAPDPFPATFVTITAVSEQDPTKQGVAMVTLAYDTPTLTDVTPANGLWKGPAVTVQITGSNFSHGSVVSAGGVALVTTYVSATQLTAVVPSSSLENLGSLPVAVTTVGVGGGTSSARLFSVVGGSLNVTVSELPSVATTAIQVVGPAGFSQTLNGPGTVTGLAGGAYTVTAGTGSTPDSTFPPDLAVQTALIVSLTPAEVGVKYSTGIYKTVKVLDADGAASLAFVQGSQTLAISQLSQVAMGLKSGDVLVLPDALSTPGGAVVLVNNVSLSYDQVLVDYVPGTISDVLSQMDISINIDLAAAPTPFSVKTPVGVRVQNLTHEQAMARPMASPSNPCIGNLLTIQVEGNIDLSANASGTFPGTAQMDATGNGTLDICPNVAFKLHSTWSHGIDSVSAAVSLGEYGELQLSDEAGIDLSGEVQLFKLKLPAVPFNVLGVPLYFQPVVTGVLGATGSVSGRLAAGASQSVTAGYGVAYAGGNWNFNKSSPVATDGVEPVEVSANAYAQLYLKPKLELDVNAGLAGVSLAKGGVYVEPKVYVIASADLNANPWYTIEGGLDGGIGITVSALDDKFLKDYPITAQNLYDHVLKTSNGKYIVQPVLTALYPNPLQAKPAVQTVGLTGSGFSSGMNLVACLSAVCNTVPVDNSGSTSGTANVLLNRSGSWTFVLEATNGAVSAIYRTTVSEPTSAPAVTGVNGNGTMSIQAHTYGQILHIAGTGFQQGAQVQFCATGCYAPPLSGAQVTVASPNEIICTATLSQAGTLSVIVINPDAGRSSSFPFTVQGAFNAAITPGLGLVGSTQFTLAGSGATPGGTVTRNRTLPDGSSASGLVTADDKGYFATTFTVGTPGPYIESFVDNVSKAQLPSVTYSAKAQQGDFALTVDNATAVTTVGGGASFTLRAASSGGFQGTVVPSALNWDKATGSTASWAPTSFAISQASAGSSVFTVQTAASTPAGAYPITLVGTSGSVTHSLPVTLTVTGTNAAPTVVTGQAVAGSTGNEGIYGTVNPNGAATQYQFAYGTSSTLAGASLAPMMSVGSGSIAVSVNVELSGLQTNTTYYYQLRATNSSGSSVGQILSFTMSSVTNTPTLSVSSNTLSFGSMAVGSSATQTLTVNNSGSGSLAPVSASLSGANTSDFVLMNHCTAALGAGGSCTIDVRFTPGSTGGRSATLTMSSAGANGSPQSVNLSGAGGSSGVVAITAFVSPSNPTAGVTTVNITITASPNAAVSVLEKRPDGSTYTAYGTAISGSSTYADGPFIPQMAGTYTETVSDNLGDTPYTFQFTVSKAPAPVLTSTSPSTLTHGSSNQPITLTGANFVSGAKVLVTYPGGSSTLQGSPQVVFGGSTQLSCQILAGSAGAWTLQVQNPDGQLSSVYSLTVK